MPPNRKPARSRFLRSSVSPGRKSPVLRMCAAHGFDVPDRATVIFDGAESAPRAEKATRGITKDPGWYILKRGGSPKMGIPVKMMGCFFDWKA
jgi:hypothetical protein